MTPPPPPPPPSSTSQITTRTDIHPSSKRTKPKSNEKPASSSFGFKRGFLNNTNASLATIQTKRASFTAEAATAAATTEHDECVLCCYPFPVTEIESRYKECCGELICRGCIIAQQRTLIIGTNVKKPIAGSREEGLEFMKILSSEQIMVCPFCRAEDSTNEEFVKRLWKRIDEYKDPRAMHHMGDLYLKGEHGLTKNLKKGEKFLQWAYNLGDPTAVNLLAELYTLYIPDPARMMKYLEEGVKRGNAHCTNHVGVLVAQSGNHEEANRHFMTAARSGHDWAMRNLMTNYRAPDSVVSKEDLAATLRAHKAINDKRKSEPREYAKRQKAFEEKVRITMS